MATRHVSVIVMDLFDESGGHESVQCTLIRFAPRQGLSRSASLGATDEVTKRQRGVPSSQLVEDCALDFSEALAHGGLV